VKINILDYRGSHSSTFWYLIQLTISTFHQFFTVIKNSPLLSY